MNEYKLALTAFKSQLKVGWIYNDNNIELLSYDNIGMAYYYLGDLDRAKYYHERMINNVIEPINSLQRIFCFSNEETIKRGVGNSRIDFNITSTLSNKSKQEKNAALAKQFMLSTEGDETPRLIQYNPIKRINSADLPSPREMKVSTKLGFNKSCKTFHQSKVDINNKKALLAKLRRHAFSRVILD